MNPLHTDHEHWLDLLADGELDESRRRELLLWCEQDPQRWRRCALAFLEAQCWKQQLGGSDAEQQADELTSAMDARGPERDAGAIMPASRAGEQAAVRPRSSSWRSAAGLFAMAASFLAAFSLGLLARSGWPTAGAKPVPGQAAASKGELAAQDSSSAGELDGASPSYGPGEPAGQVRLVVDGPGGAADEIQLPVVEGRSLDADFLRSQPSGLPPEMQRMLEEMGHQVLQRRELLPLRLKDGRRLIVPVDQVEVRPVGDRNYQ